MRIISWNIDGIKARYEEVKKLALSFLPDIILLQKVRNRQGLNNFPLVGYKRYWSDIDFGIGSGVATYVRDDISVERIETIELSRDGHFQLFKIDEILIGNVYVPYTNLRINDQGEYRQFWDEKFYEMVKEIEIDKKLIMCGDFNVVFQQLDSFDFPFSKKMGCFLDWERANFTRLLHEVPLFDTFRYLNPSLRKYSFFTRKEHRHLNAGWRIDYALCNSTLLPFVRRSDIIEGFGKSKSLPLIIDLQFKEPPLEFKL